MSAVCFLEYLDHSIKTMRDAGFKMDRYSKKI